MSWLTNVQAAQAAKNAATQKVSQQQAVASQTATVTQPDGSSQTVPRSSVMSPTGVDPQSPAYNAQVSTGAGGAQTLYVKQGYQATVVREYSTPAGQTIKEYEVKPAVVAAPDTISPKGIFDFKGIATVNPLTGKGQYETQEQLGVKLVTVAASAVPIGLPVSKVASVAAQGLLGAGLMGGSEYIATGKVSAQSVIVGGAEGVLFGAVGGKVNSILGLTGGGAKSVFGRVATNAALGSVFAVGNEAVTTGKVSPETVALGASYGAALGGTGELAGMGASVINNRFNIANRIRSADIPGRIKGVMPQRSISVDSVEALVNQPLPRQANNQLANVEQLASRPLPRTSDNQFASVEQLTKEPLPRQASLDVEINEKINRYNFDSTKTNAKIDAQLKESNAFDINRVNANIEKALQEAALENAAKGKPAKFTTGLGDDQGFPSQKQGNYLITQPAMKNLTISEQLNIRNPNTFNPAEANQKTAAMMGEVPSRGNYDDYSRVMGEGRTLTATKTKVDAELLRLEAMTKEPLPKSGERNTDQLLLNSIGVKADAPITNEPLVSRKVSGGQTTGLVPKVNLGIGKERVSQKMNIQVAGVDAYTSSLLKNRLMPASASEVLVKISRQKTGSVGGEVANSALVGEASLLDVPVGPSLKANSKASINIGQGQSEKLLVSQGLDLSSEQMQGQTSKTSQATDIASGQTTGQGQGASEISTKTAYRMGLQLPELKLESPSVSLGNRRGINSRSRKVVTPILSGEAVLDEAFSVKDKDVKTAFRALRGGRGIGEFKVSGKALRVYSNKKR